MLEESYLNSDLIQSGKNNPENPLTAQRWLQATIREGRLGQLDKKG